MFHVKHPPAITALSCWAAPPATPSATDACISNLCRAIGFSRRSSAPMLRWAKGPKPVVCLAGKMPQYHRFAPKLPACWNSGTNMGGRGMCAHLRSHPATTDSPLYTRPQHRSVCRIAHAAHCDRLPTTRSTAPRIVPLIAPTHDRNRVRHQPIPRHPPSAPSTRRRTPRRSHFAWPDCHFGRNVNDAPIWRVVTVLESLWC